MVKKSALVLLIKSLSKSEKRHFRLYTGAYKKDAGYLQVFDLIDKQEAPDDELIRSHFAGQRFIKQLHVVKIYLAELILKSLRNYHVDNSAYSNILDLLSDIDILFDKELYHMCLVKIDKAEKLCLRYEKQPLLVEVLSWKRRLMIAMSKQNDPAINNILDAEKTAINKLGDIHHFWHITLNFFNLENTDEILKPDPAKLSTVQAITQHHHQAYLYHFMQGRPDDSEKEITTLIEYLQQDAVRIKEDPAPYVTAISNKIGLLIGQKRWEETYPLIQLMRDIPVLYKLPQNSNFTVRLWLRLFNLELEVYRDTAQHEKGKMLINEVRTYIDQHRSVIPHDYLIMLQYQFAGIYFNARDYNNALYSVNDIINFQFSEARNDLQCYTRILNLFIHFELNNIIVLRYGIDATKRFLQKKKMLSAAEQGILQLFSKLSKAAKHEYAGIIREAYIKHFSGEQENRVQGYIDTRSWMLQYVKDHD